MSLMKNIKDQIDNHQVISFDIFDTLLLRPYVKPIDLFYHLEKIENKPGYARVRIDAEVQARKKHAELDDINLFEIYEEIPVKYKDMFNKELAFERQVLQPNPGVLELFKYALKKNKSIIIVSDMYLPEDFLSEVLIQKGYEGFKEIFVSSQCRKSKRSGLIFNHVLSKMKVNPGQIIHIGDNARSDYAMPRGYGWDAVLVPSPMDNFFVQDIRAKKFYEQNKNNLNVSIMLGVIAYSYSKHEDYWTRFGYKYAGPVIYAYAEWIRKTAKAKGIGSLLFLARDGYTLKKVFDLNDAGDISTKYVYASRALKALIDIDINEKLKTNKIEELLSIKKIIDYYKEFDASIAPPSSVSDNDKFWNDPDQVCRFVRSKLPILEELLKRKRENYAQYIKDILRNQNSPEESIGHVALIDTYSHHLTSQKLLKPFCDELGVVLAGLYWFTEVPEGSVCLLGDVYKFQKGEQLRFADWDLMEFLMTSPEAPILDVRDGVPVYKEFSNQEKVRSQIYPFVSRGAVKYAELMKIFFGDKGVSFNAAEVREWVNCFSSIPSNYDIPYISTILHAQDSNHDFYIPICKSWFDKKYDKTCRVWEVRCCGISFLIKRKWYSKTTIHLLDRIPIYKKITKKDFVCFKVLGLFYWSVRSDELNRSYLIFNKWPIVKVKKRISFF